MKAFFFSFLGKRLKMNENGTSGSGMIGCMNRRQQCVNIYTMILLPLAQNYDQKQESNFRWEWK